MSRIVRRNDRFDRGQDSERVDTMGTNVYSAKDNQSMHKSLNAEFILYQILVQRLLDENEELPPEAKEGLIAYFDPENPTDRSIMEEFDTQYRADKAIYWYTRETCIYRILNKALRTQNVDDVTAFGQFVRDLQKQLKKEYKSFAKVQKSSILTVYRGQFISKDEINRLKGGIGELISMNSFLSTSTNRVKALEFATSRAPPNDTLTSILLEILVNVKSPSRPLADIKLMSAFAEEEEILFMFGCVFRLDDVWFDEEHKLWRARLTLCGENDEDMRNFTATLTGELDGRNKQVSLGTYLMQLQKYEESEYHYQKIIDDHVITDEIELADCYMGLACVNDIKADYKAAISNLNKALEYVLVRSPDRDHPLISKCYNELGSIYAKESNYQKSFHYYDEALKTKNNVKRVTFAGLSKAHFQMKNYIIALRYLEQSLEQHDELEHSSRAGAYIDMGNLYAAMDEKDKASDMYAKAIESQKKLLGPNHPDLSYTFAAQAMMYSDMNDEDKAFEYMEKAYQLQAEALPSNHSDFGQTYRNFGDLYMKKGDYDKALEYYHKSLENLLKSFLWSHPSVGDTYRVMGNVHRKKKEYEQGLEYFHKVLDAELDRFGFGSPRVGPTYKIIADVYFEKQNIDEALEFYLHFLDNELETKLYEDMSLAETYGTLGKIYYKKRRLNEALLYYSRLLDCYLRKQPIDQVKVSETYLLVGKVYLKKRRFDETLLYYDKVHKKPSEENLTKGRSANSKVPKKKSEKSSSATKQALLNPYRDIDNVHFEKRHLDQALSYFEKLFNEESQREPKNYALIADLNHILGNICFEKRYFDRALTFFLQLIETKLKKKSVDDSSLSDIYKAIGSIYFEKHELNQALIYFNRLLDCRLRKKKSLEHSSIAECYQVIGKVYLAKHDVHQSLHYLNKSIQKHLETRRSNVNLAALKDAAFEKRHLEEALGYFLRLLEQTIKKQSKSSIPLNDLYIILGYLQFERHDLQQSLFTFHNLLTLQLQKEPDGDASSANTYAVLGNIYWALNKTERVLENYEASLAIYQKVQPPDTTLITSMKNKIRDVLYPML